MIKNKVTKVIIIGAGRSGTNMLRDILVQLPNCTSWDCDEINPIWKYGNRERNDDELSTINANDLIIKYINQRFSKIAEKNKSNYVIEKTCANSLRLPFVYSVVPDAKFIFIYRNGPDVIASAMKRWIAPFELKYTLKKLRYVPLKDLIFYLSRFGIARVKQLFKREKRLSFWGPRYDGMEKDIDQMSLAEICAKQWRKCVDHSIEYFSHIPKKQKFKLDYEDFVKSPELYLNKLVNFIGIKDDNIDYAEITANVRPSSVNKYLSTLTRNDLEDIGTYL